MKEETKINKEIKSAKKEQTKVTTEAENGSSLKSKKEDQQIVNTNTNVNVNTVDLTPIDKAVERLADLFKNGSNGKEI